MQCAKCGQELIDGARFCGHCGAAQTAVQQSGQPVQQPTQQAPIPQPRQKAPKKPRQKAPKQPVNKSTLIVWIVSGVLILAAIVMVLAFVVFPDGLHFGDNKTTASYEREDRDDDRDERDDEDDTDDDADEAEDTAEAADNASDEVSEESFEEAMAEPAEDVVDETAPEEPAVHVLPADATIGVVLMAANQTIEDAFISEVSDRGGELIIIDSDGDAGKEAAGIETLIAQGVDAIILVPIGQIPETSIQAAQDAGIYVVIAAYGDDGDYYTVTQDATALGKWRPLMRAITSLLLAPWKVPRISPAWK